MATQADAYMDIQIGGKNLAICRRCGDLVGDTGIHTTWHNTAAATAFPGPITVAWPTTSQHGHLTQ
jgi:hypothetical protein